MTNMVYLFKGSPITELTHEELLVAYRKVADTLQQARSWRQEDREMEQLFRETATVLGIPARQ